MIMKKNIYTIVADVYGNVVHAGRNALVGGL